MHINLEAIKEFQKIPDDYTGKLILHCKEGKMLLLEQQPAATPLHSGRLLPADEVLRMLDRPLTIAVKK